MCCHLSWLMCCVFCGPFSTDLFLCKQNQLGAQIFLVCLLLFSTCFRQLCANHQEKMPYLCDTWYLSLQLDIDIYSHLHRVTNTRCRIGTVFSPDDGHIVARNMQRKAINILTLWPWKWTFKQQHAIYVKCEYFTNQKR